MNKLPSLGRECVLLNLDNGDVINLGKVYGTAPIPEYGYNEEFPLFNGFIQKPLYDNDKRIDLLVKEATELNYFLACSIGCRLIILSEKELMRIVKEAGDESGDAEDGVLMYWLQSDYFERRNANILGKYDPDLPDRKAMIDEIKALVKKNFVRLSEVDPRESRRNPLVFRWGGNPPGKVLFDRDDRRHLAWEAVHRAMHRSGSEPVVDLIGTVLDNEESVRQLFERVEEVSNWRFITKLTAITSEGTKIWRREKNEFPDKK